MAKFCGQPEGELSFSIAKSVTRNSRTDDFHAVMHKRLIKRSWEWNITVDNQSASAAEKAFAHVFLLFCG